MPPASLPGDLLIHWNQPWTSAARNSIPFRAWLRDHGYLTPHFTMAEAACKDPAHTSIPHALQRKARDHAFNLERLRHRLGDKPMPVLSWYRTPAWNHHVGGAAQSRHMQADATDFALETVRRLPGFDEQANKVFAKGGFGTYPGGNRHVDSRGWRARWSSWVPGLRALINMGTP